MNGNSKNGWRQAPRWFLVTVIGVLLAALSVAFGLVLPAWMEDEKLFRQRLRSGLEKADAAEKLSQQNAAQIEEIRSGLSRMEHRAYDQHRDVLRFYLYYAEEQGDARRVGFFRERLRELEANPPKGDP